MKKVNLELCPDYEIINNGHATATGLPAVLKNTIELQVLRTAQYQL